MPGFTPVLGIPYPLLNETVDPSIFTSFAQVVNTAILTNQTTAQFKLTGRPTFKAFTSGANNPATAPNTVQNLSLTSVDDNNSFWNVGNPTRATINTAGVYLILVGGFNSFGFTTMTKQYLDILYNTVQILAISTTHGPPGAQFVENNLPFMWPFFAGDFIQFRWQWQGTGTNQIFNANYSLQWLCPLT